MYSPLVTVSSPPKGRFGIRVLFVLGGNHFRLIFVVGRKKHQLMTSGFVTWCERGTWQKLAATMEPVWDGVSRQILLRPRGVSGGLHGNQEPGTWDPGVWSCILVGGRGALLSRAEHPLLCLGHHPSSLPYMLMSVGTELTETSSQGNEGREVNQEAAVHVPSSSAASWRPVCWDDGWSTRTSVLPSGILPFLLKAFEKILFFSKPFYQSSLMSALSSKPIVVETSAPLSWI